MKLWRAIWCGALGAVVMLILLLIMHWIFGTRTDLSRLAGGSLGLEGARGWLVGLAAQLIAGAIAGIIYAALFEYVAHRAGPLVGLAIAVPHACIAGVLVGFLPLVPIVNAPDLVTAPGVFLSYRGWLAVVSFVVAHLIFGTLVGSWYGRTRHGASPRAPAWREIPLEQG